MLKKTKVSHLPVMLCILCVIFLAGDYFIRFQVVLPGFSDLEKQEAIKDITRCTSAIEREFLHVEKLATDWALWDDLYQYAIDGNVAFEASNFQWDTLHKTGIHLLYVINADGRIVYSGMVEPATGERISLAELPTKTFAKDHYLLQIPADAAAFSGIVLSEKGVLLLSANRIRNSAGEGPSHGIILVGRFLDEGVLRDLIRHTKIHFTVRDSLTTEFSDADKLLLASLATNGPIVEAIDDETLRVFGFLHDIQKQPALLVTATLPRHIMARGRHTARISSITSLAAIGLIIFAAFTLSLLLAFKSRRRQEEIEALVELRTDQLRLSEERLKALADASFEAVFLTEAGICLEQNKAAETLFGYTNEEAIGRPTSMWIAPEDRWLDQQKTQDKEEKPYEINAIRKNGEILPVEIQTREGMYRGRTVRVSAIRDLTRQKEAEKERQLMEEKLLRAQKMESIGMMAGGVAHDLNNILSGIVTYPELILMNLPEDSPLQRPIKAIHDSGKSAAAVVEDLLTLARGISSQRTICNINDILREYKQSPEFHNLQTLHPHVGFSFHMDPHLLNINCSAIHIKKCIMNLITNGAEAILSRGEVVVSMHNHYCETPLPGHPQMHRGEYAVLSVADSGTGIPEESLERIFEPFFSRKVIGRSGTGLGLAIIWNTVQDHQGGITVKSGSDGTTFELFFPATREEELISHESIDIERYKGKGETILIVDDDKGQRSIAQQLLNRLGYTSHAVDSGEEALRYLSREVADLVILDMIMAPGMNGCETYRKILELHPRQKALITSGYAESRDVQTALALGVGKFVKKPYLIGTLAVVIKDILESP